MVSIQPSVVFSNTNSWNPTDNGKETLLGVGCKSAGETATTIPN